MRYTNPRIKCVAFKTLIEKKQPVTQVKRPHYPIWVLYPQIGNQWLNATLSQAN